jgi:predicted nucleic acid-binding protein
MPLQKCLFQYLFDSSSLINIERNKKMTVLRKRKGEVLIPQKVADEVKQPNTPLARFVSSFPDVVVQLKGDEDRQYLRVRSQVGIDDGEAAAIAVAMNRHLPLVIDDKKGSAKAANHGIQTYTWDDFVKGNI